MFTMNVSPISRSPKLRNTVSRWPESTICSFWPGKTESVKCPTPFAKESGSVPSIIGKVLFSFGIFNVAKDVCFSAEKSFGSWRWVFVFPSSIPFCDSARDLSCDHSDWTNWNPKNKTQPISIKRRIFPIIFIPLVPSQ